MAQATQEFIEIRGARENNLKDVSLRIPKRQTTIFTGVSGSGKSSIVFDTLATEAQRQLYETFSMFVRNFLPRYSQPEADSIENLGMAIVVDQKRLGGGSHSTMGTITDIYTVLRLLFSRVGEPFIGYSNVFSFNDPLGMCPECNGFGRKLQPNAEKILDMDKSLNEGPVRVPGFGSWVGLYQASGFFDNDKKLSDYTKEELELLLHGSGRKVNMGGFNATYEGILLKFNNSYIKRDLKALSERTQKQVAPYLHEGLCPSCNGARLNKSVLSCKINGYNIAELSAMEIGELIEVIKGIKGEVAKPLVDNLLERLQNVVGIGLEYLTLNRETDTLSGGESQRIKMVKHLSSSLIDVMYIFDEPSVGLHPRDVHRLNELLQKLRDKGNTVLVVEHDPQVIQIADHIVDVGPHAGSQGGEIVYEGSYTGLLKADTVTGKFLKKTLPIKAAFRQAKGQLKLSKVTVNNLKAISVDIPVGVLTAVTGVAGSGKSSLINQAFVESYSEAIVIDQSAVGANSRSNPATYTGIMDDVRKAFAKANNVNAGLFSFNSKGACENCQGLGVVYTDLSFFDVVKSPCEICGGKRFKDEVLAYKLNGKSIADVLEMTVSQALEHFEQPEITRKLQAMSDVGLTYLKLGQPLNTLSGGECQRIKLASELHKEGSIYVMDEPTTGLHMSDTANLLAIMNRLVDSGNTVIVIEHNMDVVRNADWVIDMGPEGGSRGGQVMFEGTPAELQKAKGSITSQYV
ncbi:MAG: excinuclease ABC subunit UvrA [Anaerolineales bacterium]|nr:excinuclease ABC subunit UvrA [Anaerolineales bacterium]MCW5856193.1 excinuclease ABC subunit UvrA [Anaerolineales bacterium]